MCLAVAPHQPRAVHRDHHRQVLETDIMECLVVCPLQKRRIHGKHWFHSPCGKPCRKCHGMFLRDPHIKKPLGEMLRKRSQPCAVLHCRRDRHYFIVPLCDIGQDLGEHLGISVRSAGSFRLPGLDIKRTGAVELRRVFLRRSITFALLCDHMDKDRMVHPLRLIEDFQKFADIMAVHRSQISDVHILKKHPRHKELLDPALCLPDLAYDAVASARDPLQRILHSLFQVRVCLCRPQPA